MTTEEPIDPTADETAVEEHCEPKPKYTDEEFAQVQKIAYDAYEERLKSGITGDEKSDWAQAELIFARDQSE